MKSSNLYITFSVGGKLIFYEDALWDYVVPYLKNICLSQSCPYQVSDIAANLTAFHLKLSVTLKQKDRAVDLFTFFITRENMDVK